LKSLGLLKAFTNNAEFAELLEGEHDLFVSKVIHKTFLSFDEKGTKAVAATGITVTLKSASQKISMNVDRPFFLFIRHIESQQILFSSFIQNL